MQLCFDSPVHANGGLIFKAPTELCDQVDLGSTFCFDSPVHPNGGLIFKPPTELCIVEFQSRGGAGGGKAKITQTSPWPGLGEEEEILAAGLTIILMELL